MKVKPFKFEMGQAVAAQLSNECGTVIGRAQYDHSESTYLVRYIAADGQQRESWWQESATKDAPKR